MSAPDTPPATSSTGLVADLVCRTVLAVVANAAVWVPFRLLWKNGEFAAALLCGVVMLMNLIYFVNGLVWRDDDTAGWYDGAGWCDLQAYITVPLRTTYAACITVIMRHLATQLNLARASGLTHAEKRRRNLVQALIIFPLPLLQVALTYPLLQTRYAVMTLLGCEPYFAANPLSLTFFFLAQPVFCAGALVYAVLAYVRFRALKKTTQAVHSANSSATSRANRTKRKLYGMTLSILLPYSALIFVFLYRNIGSETSWGEPYSLARVRESPLWNRVLYVTSDQAGFPRMQLNYVAILTAVPIFLFFGTTSEAINTWRRYLLALGLGRPFPGLREEYDPDRPKKGSGGSSSSAGRNPHSLQSWGASTLASSDRKPSVPTHQEDQVSPPRHGSISQGDAVPPSAGIASTHSRLPIISHDDDEVQLPRRVPWLFRTTLVTPPLPFPKFGRRKDGGSSSSNNPPPATAMTDMPPRPSRSGSPPKADRGRPASREDHVGPRGSDQQRQRPARWEQSPTGSIVETRVWSGEEASPQRPAPARQHGTAEGWDEQAVHPGVRVRTDIATRRESKGSPGEVAGPNRSRGWGV